MKSPCLKCTRVKNPKNCEDKTCKVWRSWFVETWNSQRMQFRLAREQMAVEMEGVNIGGTRYALPHRVRSYLHTDPCSQCLSPRDLCKVPCKVKRNWTHNREELKIEN